MRSAKAKLLFVASGFCLASGFNTRAEPIGTAFTYQGQLKQGGVPVNGTCDFIFALWDDPELTGPAHNKGEAGGGGVQVSNGLFALKVDFGSGAFDGSARWLQAHVCCPSGSCAGDVGWEMLSPRQELTPTPYALFAASADGGVGGFWSASGDDIYSTNVGNVGIGTTEPTAKLHIAGTPGADGIRFPDGTLQTSAATGGASAWSLTGNAGTVPGTHFVGTTDNQPLELHVNAKRALRIEPNADSPNVIGGDAANTVSAGKTGATISGGGNGIAPNQVLGNYGTIGGGRNNTAAGDDATVAGGYQNTAEGDASFIGGGVANKTREWATVAGGMDNQALAVYATIGGGGVNDPWYGATEEHRCDSGPYYGEWCARCSDGTLCVEDSDCQSGTCDPDDSLCAPGACTLEPLGNRVFDDYGTVSGGTLNRAGTDDGDTTTARYATVGGGQWNAATEWSATVAGGTLNRAWANSATVGGGYSNYVLDDSGTIGGGQYNLAFGRAATVAGGRYNLTDFGDYATVGGGEYNEAMASWATIAGGGPSNPQDRDTANKVWDNYGTIGGGGGNIAGSADGDAHTAKCATVGGGAVNEASGYAATVPGGFRNVAGGYYSFAAGSNARVRRPEEVGGGDTDGDEGTFVWADAPVGDFQSTGPNQFLIRAEGGVGIGTNQPTAQLHVSATGASVGVRTESETESAVNALTSSASISEWTPAIYGRNEGAGDGVYGWSQNRYGIVGVTSSDDVRYAAVWGRNNGAGLGLRAEAGSGGTAARFVGDVRVEGDICYTGSSGACSDARFKKNVKRIDNPLDKVRRLRGVQFDWRRDEYPNRRFNEGRQAGFIAQEVEAVLPEVVSKDGDGFYFVDYSRVVPTLVEAVKELHTTVKGKDAMIASLRADNAKITQRLAKLEAAMAQITEGGVQ